MKKLGVKLLQANADRQAGVARSAVSLLCEGQPHEGCLELVAGILGPCRECHAHVLDIVWGFLYCCGARASSRRGPRMCIVQVSVVMQGL